MRRAWLFILLNGLAGLAMASPWEEHQFIKFYERRYPAIQKEYVYEIAKTSMKWAQRLCLEDQLDTLLSMVHVESNDLNPYEDDRLGLRRSLGFYQTREQYMPALRAFWKANGFDLGPNDSVDTQCAFGVAEFYMQLQIYKGSMWYAVKGYNGGGHKASEYAAVVFRFREKVFGRAHEEGEAHATTCGKLKVKRWKL